ncbi:MAG TPA: sigma-70 family RNA polymerase sigma factor [Candidatus Dormibacteraeota bacterium]|nr:sigma-70 family RNA polymerase sigma factor [Candidatus Dormibacteraeota bacterium]
MRPDVKQAVELLQQNDPKSLEEALALLQNTVFSFSMKVCGQRQDAEDTMQEVLLKSVSQLPKFDSPRALAVWLYKVAKNRCLMSRRKSKFAPKENLSLESLMPGRRELESFSEKTRKTPETSLLHHENAKLVRQAVQKLPPEYRLILVLHDMEELSDTEVAEITGLRPGTIRVRLHRARLFVRKELAMHNGQRPARLLRKITAGPVSAAPSRQPQGEQAKTALESASVPGQGRCKAMFAELSNYLDDELDDSLCEELEKHMENCRPCQAFLSTLEQSIEQCRHAPDELPDPRVAAAIRRDVLAKYQETLASLAKNRKNRNTGSL